MTADVIRHPMIDARALFAAGKKLYRDGGLPRGALTGWRCVDELYSVAPGQWTVVTGIPQSGKSEWLDALLVNLAEQDDWQFAVYSPENWPAVTHLAKLVEKVTRKPFGPGPTPRMSEAEYSDAAMWVLEHFAWLDPDLKSPQELITTGLAYRKPSKRFGLVLDPWNTLDHERQGLSDTDYISTVLTDVQRMVRKSEAHCWLVVHPQKIYKDRATGQRPVPSPYDISGSAHSRAEGPVQAHRPYRPGDAALG
jgi:twinkle protein